MIKPFCATSICSGKSARADFLWSSTLFQKPVDDLRFGLAPGEAERHEFGELLVGDFADGGFVDKGGVDALGVERRGGGDLGVVHDDGVTFGMAATVGGANDVRGKVLN